MLHKVCKWFVNELSESLQKLLTRCVRYTALGCSPNDLKNLMMEIL